MTALSKVYMRMPLSLRLVLSPFIRHVPRLAGEAHPLKEEEAYFGELRTTEFAAGADLRLLQLRKLLRLLRYSCENVPFYQDLRDRGLINPDRIETLDDFVSTFPIVTKRMFREQSSRFISRRMLDPGVLIPVITGGSTGTPMRFLFDRHSIAVERAHLWRWSRFAGVDLYGSRMLYIGGLPSKDFPPEKYGGLVNPAGTRLSISPSVLSASAIDRYVEQLRRFRPDHIRGYASGVHLFALALSDRGVKFPIRAVLTSSDKLFPEFRATIEKTFGCQVFDHYGQMEDAITATECGYEQGFHVNTESHIVETVDSSGRPVIQSEGHLLGTNLENYCMPLIRYDTGDVGVLSAEFRRCGCGRSHQKILSFSGRDDEIIVTADGRRGTPAAMSYPTKNMGDSVVMCQYVQESPGLLRAIVVPGLGWRHEVDPVKLEENIRMVLGNRIEIRIETVDRIPLMANGKYRFIKSRIGVLRSDCV